MGKQQKPKQMHTKLISFLLSLLLFAISVTSQTTFDCGNSLLATVSIKPQTKCSDLFAGQHILIGQVCATLTGDEVDVIYSISEDGWRIDYTHFWYGEDAASYPSTRNGNPKIGNFPYAGSQLQYSIPLSAFFVDACDSCGSSKEMYFLAHAEVSRWFGGLRVQTETAWSDGAILGRSWATQSAFTAEVDCSGPTAQPSRPDDYQKQCETAFATALDSDSKGACFIGLGFKRWGWSIGPLSHGDYAFSVYAGAGKCNLNKGADVCDLLVSYEGEEVEIEWDCSRGVELKQTHLYVGSDQLPTNRKGKATVAPGQYPYKHKLDQNAASDSFTVSTDGGDIYLIAHAVTCY